MKYVLFLFAASILGACSENSEMEVGSRTTMEVKKVYDAGDVVKGELVRAKFVVKNTGENPLVIAEVTPSCSCTVSEFPEEPIMPGKTGTIIATVDTDRTSTGAINKNVNVTANTTPTVTPLLIKANVITK